MEYCLRIHHLSDHNCAHTKTLSSLEPYHMVHMISYDSYGPYVLVRLWFTERYFGSPSTIPYAIMVCENEAVSNARNGIFVKIFKNGVWLNFGRSLKRPVNSLIRDSGGDSNLPDRFWSILNDVIKFNLIDRSHFFWWIFKIRQPYHCPYYSCDSINIK